LASFVFELGEKWTLVEEQGEGYLVWIAPAEAAKLRTVGFANALKSASDAALRASWRE
jgi:hypothetical protein